jgi:Zn-dependent peptidase ImmA (M78 family)
MDRGILLKRGLGKFRPGTCVCRPRPFRGVHFPPLNLPLITASTFEEIETAAEQCRHHWKLGIDTPLLQIGEVLEDAGVVIARHVVESKKVDTFSHYGGGMTIILPNQEIQSGPRWNFDMAHELGHLVMHRRILTGTVETERAANRFASAFLIPRRAFEREFQAESFSRRHVHKLKIRWQMRAAAIVRRAYDLRLLGAVEYRKAVKYMSVKGWTKKEPYERALHYSERFENAVNYLAQRGSLPTFCEALGFTPDTFSDLVNFWRKSHTSDLSGLPCDLPAASQAPQEV